MLKLGWTSRLLNLMAKHERRLLSYVVQRNFCLAHHSSFSTAAASGKVPFILKTLHFKDFVDEVSPEQISAFERIPPGRVVQALSAMQKSRFFNASRAFIHSRLKTPESLTPPVFLELCRAVQNIFLENVQKAEDAHLVSALREHLSKMPHFCAETAKLFLHSCTSFDGIPKLPSNLVDRDGVVTAILGNFLRARRFEDFDQLLQKEPKFPILSSPPLFNLLVDVIEDAPRLAKVVLDRAAKETGPIDAAFLDPLKKLLRQSKHWSVNDTKVSDENQCQFCGKRLQGQDVLNSSEFAELQKAVRHLVTQGAASYAHGAPAELRALLGHVKRLPKVNGRSLVVDALNATGGRHYSDLIYKKLLYALQDFSSVMVVTRVGESVGLINRIRSLKVTTFACDKRSDDDLFILLAALERGPMCHILSNDQYAGYQERLPIETIPLYKRWLRTRVVRHDPRNTDYYMPESYALIPHCNKDTFHLPFILPRGHGDFTDKYIWLCIKRLPGADSDSSRKQELENAV